MNLKIDLKKQQQQSYGNMKAIFRGRRISMSNIYEVRVPEKGNEETDDSLI